MLQLQKLICKPKYFENLEENAGSQKFNQFSNQIEAESHLQFSRWI